MLLRLTTIVASFLLWVPVAQAWTWPVKGPVLQAFSYDEAHPYAAGQHRGIDIGASAAGGPVVAPAGGTVSFAGSVPTSGKSVTIETPDGYSVTLTHLGSIAVADGASVAEGAPVGTIGPSGTPEEAGPYVHLGIRETADANGYLDPLSLLPPLVLPPPDSTGPSSGAGSGSPSHSHSGRTAVSSGGGIVIRARPRARSSASSRQMPERTAMASTSTSTSARAGRSARAGNSHTTRQRPEAKRPQRHEQRAQTPEQPTVETVPVIAVHAAPPLPRSATSPSLPRRLPVEQPLHPLQLGLAAGPGLLAGLAAIGIVLARLRRRRRDGDTALVARLYRLPSQEPATHRAA